MAKRARNAAAESVETEPQDRDELAELKAQLQEMQGRLSTTETALAQERSGRVQAETRSMSEAERRLLAEENSCDTAIASISSEAESLESQIASLADEPGHGKEVAALTRKLSQAETRLFNEQQRKTYIANQRASAAQQAEQRAKAPTGRTLADGTPLEIFNPQVRAWFEAHPQSFSDRAFVAKCRAAASAAISLEGIPENSDDYFAYVEEKVLGPSQRRRAEPVEDLDDTASADSPYSQPRQTRQAADPDGEDLDYKVRSPQPPAAGRGAMSSAAPPSRAVPTGSPGSRRAPALTNEEREVALDLYPGMAQADALVRYAESKKLMTAKYPGRFSGMN